MTDEIAESQGEVLPEETGEAAQHEDPAPSPEETQDQDDSPADEKPKAKGVQKRIDELTANWRNAERDRDYWRELAVKARQEPEKPQEPSAPQPEGKPVLDQFESYDAYLEALSDWKVDQRLKAQQEETRRTQEQQTAQEREVQFQTRVQSFAESHPDFNSVVTNPALPISTQMYEAAQSLEKGPELLYHLGQNPEEAARIYRLSPTQQYLEMGRIEASLARPARNQTRAPDPVAPVSGSGGAQTFDPDKLSAEQFRDWRNKQEAERNKR